MGLMINPAPTFTLNDGSVASEGKLYFYENGSTTIEKDVFLKPNLDPAFKLNNPLTLTDAGRLPTCFGTGTYTIVLESAAGVQQWVRNDVTIDDLTGQFADYSSVKTYKANEIVRYTDGNYYASQKNNNKGNVPAVNSEWWFQIAFLELFNTAKAADEDYMENDIVIFNGFIYRSLEDNNGDTPPSAKWANLTFNDSVAGNFTVGGDLSVSGDLALDGDISSNNFRIASRSTDNDIASSATLTQDAQLTISDLDIDTFYLIKGFIRWTGNNSTINGLQLKVSGNLSEINLSLISSTNQLTSGIGDPPDLLVVNDFSDTFFKLPDSVFQPQMLLIDGFVKTLGTGTPDIFVQWSQVSSDAIPTTVLAGSHITATKL